jgi:hypothetical protein
MPSHLVGVFEGIAEQLESRDEIIRITEQPSVLLIDEV